MPMTKTTKLIAALATLSVAAGLSSCAAPRTDANLTTASIENDYRARHPITMAEVEHTLDIPVASTDRSLNLGVRDSVEGFAQDYARLASGTLQVAIPAGSVNAAAASRVRGEVKSLLVRGGVKADRIAITTYAPESAEVSAPIHLSYIAITAITNECGKWPDDLMNNSLENKNWYNFGCASQNNLAAQIANPMDLKAPRAMTPIDAERRSTVIGLYREGSSTTTN